MLAKRSPPHGAVPLCKGYRFSLNSFTLGFESFGFSLKRRTLDRRHLSSVRGTGKSMAHSSCFLTSHTCNSVLLQVTTGLLVDSFNTDFTLTDKCMVVSICFQVYRGKPNRFLEPRNRARARLSTTIHSSTGLGLVPFATTITCECF